MKKIYILAVALVAFAFTGTSQIIEDDFEFYNLGDMGTQNPTVWSSWSNEGGATAGEGIIVTDTFGNSGQSGAENTAGQDALLLLGNQTSGDYTLAFDVYIPTGQTGYFNVQGEIPAEGTALDGVFNSGNITLADGAMVDDANPDTSMAFPHDAWFRVAMYVDMDAATPTLTFTVDGVEYDTLDFREDTTLGGLDIFFSTPSDEMYIDNVLFVDGVLGTNDYEANSFNVAMVNGQLTIQANDNIDSVEIYNMLGQQVYNGNVGSPRTTINMSSFANGTYIVRASVNGTLSTVKVIK